MSRQLLMARRRPYLASEGRRQALESLRFARTRLINTESGNTASRESGRQLGPIQQFLAALPAMIRGGIPADLKLARVLEFEEERLPRGEELITPEREIDILVTTFLRRYVSPQTSDKALEVAAMDMVSIVRGTTDATINRGGNLDDLTERVGRAMLGYLKPLLAGSRAKI